MYKSVEDCFINVFVFQNRDYIQTHCNDRRNTFHFACRQWYSRYTYMNTYINTSIIVFIFV